MDPVGGSTRNLISNQFFPDKHIPKMMRSGIEDDHVPFMRRSKYISFCCNRNRNLQTSKASFESQAQSTAVYSRVLKRIRGAVRIG